MRYLDVWQAVALLLGVVAAAQACTVLQFTDHSFSANAVRLLHALPIFEGTNGTLYFDTSLSTHKCHPDGGWHDFFELGHHAEPYTLQKEKAGGEVCARYSLGEVDSVVHDTGLAWEELMLVSIRRVWKLQPWIKTLLVSTLRKLDGAKKPTIAFHIKATGKTPVQKHTALAPMEYVSLFTKIYPHVKGGTCLIAGGDEKLNKEMQALATEVIGCAAFDRTATHKLEGLPPGVANTSSLAGQCLSTRNLLMDLELLSHADYFVGTQKSALSPIIEILRTAMYGKPRRTFLTHGGDWYSRIREFFQGPSHPSLEQQPALSQRP